MKLILTFILVLATKLVVPQASLDVLLESFEQEKYRDLYKSSEIIQKVRSYTTSENNEARVKAYSAISDFYSVKGQFTIALLYLDSAANILEMNGIPFQSKFILKQGVVNSYAGANDEALNLYREALLVATDEGPRETANVYLAIGEILRKAANYEMATKYLDSAHLSLTNVDDSESILARIYNRKAAVLNEIGEIEESIELSNVALEYAIATNNIDLMATSYNEIGYSEWHLDKTKGLDKVLKAANLWSQIGKKRYEVSALLNAVKFNLEDGRIDSAIQLLGRCDSIVNGNPWNGIKAEIFKFKDMIARSEGDFEAAYSYIERYHYYNNLYNEALRNEKIQRIQYDFRLKEKDADIKLKENLLANERKSLLQKDKINQQLKKRERLVVVLLILALLLLLVLFWSRKKVVKQSEELEKTNFQLNEALENQSFLLREIHHRVKNNLQVITSLLEMQSNAQDDDRVKQVLLESKGRVASMNLIHSKLYHQEDLSYVQMDEYILNLHREIAALFKPDILPRIEIDVNSVMVDTKIAVHIGIMLNELITNTYKYGIVGHDSVLKLSLRKMRGSLSLEYEDNGPGFDYALFETPQSNSIGLRIVKNMLRQMNAKYELDTSGKMRLKMEIKVRENDSYN